MIGTILLETTSALLQSWLGSAIGGIQLTVYSLILMTVILWRSRQGSWGTSRKSTRSGARKRRSSDHGRRALVIKNLNKRFGGLRAVQDVTFTVRENETLALIGPNGAGKTTAFNLIMGFHRPDEGSVMAFGKEIVGLRPHDVCAHGLARTFQVAKPFGGMTVLDNVMTGAFLHHRSPDAAREKRARGHRIRRPVGARDDRGEGSDDDRSAAPEMARALATQPELLLLDEVMAGSIRPRSIRPSP